MAYPDDPDVPGSDEYDRVWRARDARGVEHSERDRAHIPAGFSGMMASRPGAVYSWCGLSIERLDPSVDCGDRRPCANCLRSEYAAED